MKQIITILFLVIALNSNASDIVRLNFFVKNGVEKEIVFKIFDNYITRDTWNYTCKIDSSGRGIITFKLDRPRETFFQVDRNYFLFLTPGDDLDIEFDYQNPRKTMEYKGKGAVNCNFILEYSRNYNDPSTAHNLMEQGFSNERYKQEINERWKNRKAFYDKYAAENDLSREFRYYAQGLVDYGSIKEHLNLQACLEKVNNSVDDVSQFYSFLDRKYFDNDSILKYYQGYLSAASFYSVICEKPEYDSIHSIGYQLLNSQYSNRTRDFLISKYLVTTYGSNEYFDQDYQSFKANCKEMDIHNILENAFKKYSISQIPKEILKTKLVSYHDKKITLKKLMALNKDKVIYIDFWGSYCAPCIKELPFLETMKNNIPELPLEVISFSIDGNPLVWKKTISDRGMSLDNQYLLTDAINSEICKYYSINAIPRFILINTNSKLVTAKAPQASDPLIKEKIISLINSYNDN